MTNLSLEDIEFIKILAKSDSILLEAGINEATRHRLDSKIGMILREYYRENTMNIKNGWKEKFQKAEITEDEGKAAISCARRFGIDIS